MYLSSIFNFLEGFADFDFLIWFALNWFEDKGTSRGKKKLKMYDFQMLKIYGFQRQCASYRNWVFMWQNGCTDYRV